MVVVDGPMERLMPDLRTILRSLTPGHALRNARREVVEHARVLAEIDAIVQRIPAAPGPDTALRITELAAAEASAEVVPAVSNEPVIEDRRAS